MGNKRPRVNRKGSFLNSFQFLGLGIWGHFAVEEIVQMGWYVNPKRQKVETKDALTLHDNGSKWQSQL